ncbi:MAG: hypothetical protein HY801_13125 [Candidatus Lindowbacteria bacterium]|nr:hypothetical protein [Candidatus Lindowbacteria bacterium]
MDAEYIFIVNPSSGGGKGEEVARLLNRMLPDHPAFCDGKGQVFFANHVDAGMLRDTLADARAVVAVGGDGTAHHLIPYLLSGATPPVLGLIPLGTSNDLARALGVPMDKDYTDERILRKTLDELLGAEATNLDVLSVNEEVFFTNYFSIGLDAIIVRDFDDVRKSSWAKLLPAGKITNNF